MKDKQNIDAFEIFDQLDDLVLATVRGGDNVSPLPVLFAHE